MKAEIQMILKQLQAIPTLQIIKSAATKETIEQFICDYNIHLSDFFDFCLMSFCNKNNYAIVSDDRDFSSSFCEGVFYSANPKI